jgi:hypothetical protein
MTCHYGKFWGRARALMPEAGKLPLIGRKDLFAELQAWLDDEADISVFGLIGRVGTGKTRLALELCRAIDRDRGAKNTLGAPV